MNILHLSDNHGSFKKLPKADLILHTGDMLPNSRFWRDHTLEKEFQDSWLLDNTFEFQEWLGVDSVPFVFCPGNHDFIDPTVRLQEFGINAIDVANKHATVAGLRIYGFPYIPAVGGWNWELFDRGMCLAVTELIQKLNEDPVDILMCHAPLLNYLDNVGPRKLGIKSLADAFKHAIDPWPKIYACGHIHEARGITKFPDTVSNKSMIYSNAATTMNMLYLPDP